MHKAFATGPPTESTIIRQLAGVGSVSPQISFEHPLRLPSCCSTKRMEVLSSDCSCSDYSQLLGPMMTNRIPLGENRENIGQQSQHVGGRAFDGIARCRCGPIYNTGVGRQLGKALPPPSSLKERRVKPLRSSLHKLPIRQDVHTEPVDSDSIRRKTLVERGLVIPLVAYPAEERSSFVPASVYG